MKYVGAQMACQMLGISYNTLSNRFVLKEFVPAQKIHNKRLYTFEQIELAKVDAAFNKKDRKLVILTKKNERIKATPIETIGFDDDFYTEVVDTSLSVSGLLSDGVFKSIIDQIVSKRIYLLMLFEEDFKGNDQVIDFLENLCKSARVVCRIVDRPEIVEIVEQDKKYPI